MLNLFGRVLRNNPQPVLPLYAYLTERGQPVLVRAVGHWHNELVVLFQSRHRATQALHPALQPTSRIVELTTVAGLAGYLRHSGAGLISIEPEPVWSEPGCYSHVRTDCPLRLADALAALETPPPPVGPSAGAMIEPAGKRAASCLR